MKEETMCQRIHFADLPVDVADALLAETNEYDMFPFEPDELSVIENEWDIVELPRDRTNEQANIRRQSDVSGTRPEATPAQAA